MRMVVYQRSGDRSPIAPPTVAELNRHRWHSTRRGTVSFAAAPEGGVATWVVGIATVAALAFFWWKE